MRSNLKQPVPVAPYDPWAVAETAADLLVATAQVAGDKVAVARLHLATALDEGCETYFRARAEAGPQPTNVEGLAEVPFYRAVGLAFGFGALVGLFLARRN
jgi:ElaB/YqjD/DUF883 family membrane-anchored ribosome-binding protein